MQSHFGGVYYHYVADVHAVWPLFDASSVITTPELQGCLQPVHKELLKRQSGINLHYETQISICHTSHELLTAPSYNRRVQTLNTYHAT